MNRTKIDWPNLDYTWNPVVGCCRMCSYCYAKRMNDRFKWVKDFSIPQLFPKRLVEPYKVKKPSTIFVGSMTDLCFCNSGTMKTIIDICAHCPEHTFMFLTKDPSYYTEYEWPDNTWLGATVTHINSSKSVETCEALMKLENRKFLSIEPILGPVNNVPKEIELVIVGAMTGPGAIKPQKEWIESIKHPNIHYKENIKRYL